MRELLPNWVVTVRKTSLHVAACLLTCGALLSPATQARATDLDRTVMFDIAAQPLEKALIAFSQQADIQVVLNAGAAGSAGAPALKGTLSVRTGLNELLKGTGFRYAPIGDRTVSVMRDGASSAENTRTEESVEQPKGSDLRMARADAETSHASPESEKVTLEEVIVSAQKREERLKDVPISISVLSGDDLDRSTGGGVVDALNRIPGLTASGLPQTGAAFVTLRGVASGVNVGAGGRTTGYYLDSMPFPGIESPDTSAYDLRRVEVLRGPQGTLYGVNSIGGLVRVLTNDANLERFEAKTRLSSSLTSGGGTNYRGDAAINVPIIEGRLAARAVMGYEDQSGWVDRANKKDINDATLRSLRLKIGARPTENLQVDLSAWHSGTDFDATPASNDAGTRNVLFDEPVAIDMDIYALGLRYDFASFSLSSNTSKLYHDLDSLKRSIFSSSFLNSIRDSSVFSQEINLSSTGDSRIRWTLGAIYIDDDSGRVSRSGSVATVRSVAPTPALSGRTTSESAAVFGQLDYRFIDSLELALGVRYFEDDLTEAPLTGPSQKASFHATTPKVGLTWYPSNELTAYVVYGQGFRSGALQSQAAIAQFGLGNAEPDRLHNYEAGVKGELFDRRLSFDAAAYYMKWDDIQQSLLLPIGLTYGSARINGPSASGPGFELSTTLRPTERLDVGLTLSWNDLTFDETVFSGGLALYEKGSRLNASAEHTYGAFLNYALSLGQSGLEARFSASANYQSELVSRTLLSGSLVTIAGDPILLGRASVSVGPTNDRWSVTLFGDNVTDEDGASLGGWPAPGQDEATHLRPRTWGAQLEYRF